METETDFAPRDDKPIRYIDREKLVEMVRQIHRSCDAWMSGQKSDGTLRAEFARVRAVHWEVRGVGNLPGGELPEDFDPQSLTEQEWRELDRLEQLLQNTLFLISSVEETIDEMKQYPSQQYSSILRAHLLGKRTSQNRFNPSCTP